MGNLPSHNQLVLPLLTVLEENEGMKAKDAAEAMAEKLDLGSDLTTLTQGGPDGRRMNIWQRRVRWVRQTLVGDGMIGSGQYNWWDLTDKARLFLANCRPGVIVTVFETENGIGLWAEAETAVAYVHNEAVDLILTSPEYPLVKPKAYGNRAGETYVSWLAGLAEDWRAKLKNSGSLVINLQDVYKPDLPTLSLYQEKLLLRLVEQVGYHLCQRFIWHNPSKPPATNWVTVKRTRVKSGFETFYWLGKTPHPKANNLNVLRPYAKTMLRTLRTGGDQRKPGPSGHGHLTPGYARDNGGSIPDNVFVAHNAVSNDVYCRNCRTEGTPVHPARFPDEPLEFLIKLLTDRGDTVYDPLAGSLKVGEVAERLGRNWIASERSMTYLFGGRHRFSERGRWLGPEAGRPESYPLFPNESASNCRGTR
jgi:DNA modification methylase